MNDYNKIDKIFNSGIEHAISYRLNINDKNNIIKPNNSLPLDIEYTSQMASKAMRDLYYEHIYRPGYEGTTYASPNQDLKPVLEYILKEYSNGVSYLDIVDRLSSSYIRNLSSNTKKIVFDGIKRPKVHLLGMEDNFTHEYLEKCLYYFMINHFSRYISSIALNYYTSSPIIYDRAVKKIYNENRNVFSQIDNLEY